MKIVAIIQARTGSSRLPAKIFKEICGASMLSHVVNRTKLATNVGLVLVATTTETRDDRVVGECERLEVPVFRGSELDVLDRYYHAALSHHADVVVRITSDCPLIDPDVVDRVIDLFLQEGPDYASNGLVRSYPRGLDTEVFTFESLARAWREANEQYQRVHVTPYIYQHPQFFKLLPVMSGEDYGDYRWTVDTQEDLDFVRAVCDRLSPVQQIRWRQVLELLKIHPELRDINSLINQKLLHEG